MTGTPNTSLNDPHASQLSEAIENNKHILRRPRRAFSISALSGICIFLLVSITYLSTLQPILAQGNPTEALIKTLSSGIQQQFTLTAQALMPLTVTALNLPTYTPSVTPNATQQRQTLGAIVNNQLTLTSTAV